MIVGSSGGFDDGWACGGEAYGFGAGDFARAMGARAEHGAAGTRGAAPGAEGGGGLYDDAEADADHGGEGAGSAGRGGAVARLRGGVAAREDAQGVGGGFRGAGVRGVGGTTGAARAFDPAGFEGGAGGD